MNKWLKTTPRAIAITLVIYLVLLLVSFLNGKEITFNGIKWGLIYTMLYGLSLYYANGYVFVLFDKLFEKDRFSPKRLILGGLSSFLVSIVVIFLLRFLEDVIIENETINQFLIEEKAENYIVSLVITLIVTLSLYLFHFYKSYQENKLKEQKVIAGTASAKFESLKNQLDPHFLFNSLNVLSSLIEENPESAQKFTTSLSKVYRYVLEQRDKELVSVNEEISFAKTYMNLLKMRFENSITFSIPENIDPEAKVVPLSLQLLLENTIKHNVVSPQRPLHVTIKIENNYLVIENNLQKKETLSDRKGVGLENIVFRYALISERKVLIEENKVFFSVKIPILTKQIAFMETQNIYNENMAFVKAKERVEKLKGFYGNLISYCTVIPILIIINLNTSSGFQWFWFPMLGWGFGVIMHAIETFGYGKNWEERKIQEILDKENLNNTKWK